LAKTVTKAGIMRDIIRILFLVLCVVLISGCAPAPTPTPQPTAIPPSTTPEPTATPTTPRSLTLSQEEQVILRFIHAAPAFETVDINAGDLRIASNLAFGDAVDGARIAGGEYVITITQANSDNTTALFEEPLALAGGNTYTAILTVVEGSLRLTAIPDDTSAITANQGRLLVIHAAAGVGSIQIGQAGSTPLADSLDFGRSTPALTLAAGQLNLQIRTSNQLLAEYPLDVRPNQHHTLVLVQEDSGIPRLVEYTSIIPGQAQVRVVSGLDVSVGAVDVQLNDTLLDTSLLFGSATDLTTVTALPATLRVITQGAAPEEPPIIISSIALNNGDVTTLFLLGNEASARVIPYVDDVQAIASNETVLTLINLYSGSPSLRAIASEGIIQDTLDIAYGARPITLTLPSGENTFVWGTPDEEEMTQFSDTRTFAAGVHYLYVLTGREDAPVIVFEHPVAASGSASAIAEVAEVRWVNMLENAVVSFSLDDVRQAQSLAFREIENAEIAQGNYSLTVETSAGSSSTPFTAQAFRRYSIYVYGTAETPLVTIIEDDPITVEAGSTRVRLIHLGAAGSSPLSMGYAANPTSALNLEQMATPVVGQALTLPGGVSLLIRATEGGTASLAGRLAANTYDFYIVNDNAGGVVSTLTGIALADGAIIEIVAVRSTTSDVLSVFGLPYSSGAE
jgi:hypothetical protein